MSHLLPKLNKNVTEGRFSIFGVILKSLSNENVIIGIKIWLSFLEEAFEETAGTSLKQK